MTVPADASVNSIHTPSTNKLRPLTSLPVPMLPSELAQARPQASAMPAHAAATSRMMSIKNASLSSWLSHGAPNGSGHIPGHPPGSKSHPSDVIHPVDGSLDHPKIGSDHSQEQPATESMDLDDHHDNNRDTSSSHTPPPPPNDAPVKGKRGRKPKPKPDPNDPNAPPPKPKERKPRTPKDPSEPKPPKEKTPKKKKADLPGSGEVGGDGTQAGRSILNYFKSSSAPGKAPSAKVKKSRKKRILLFCHFAMFVHEGYCANNTQLGCLLFYHVYPGSRSKPRGRFYSFLQFGELTFFFFFCGFDLGVLFHYS